MSDPTTVIRVGDDVTGSCLPGDIHPVAKVAVNSKDYQHIVTGLVPFPHDQVVLTYDSAGNVATAVYKLATVTLATLTLTYDSSNRLTNIVRA
jgi:hypothetical protein